MSKPRAVFDIECYRNFFCINFRSIEDRRSKSFALHDGHPLDRDAVLKVLRNFTLVGFNSSNYDVPMLRLALKLGTTNDQLKVMSDAIVLRNLKPWDCEREFNLPQIPWLDHIDIIEPAPSVKVSLKLYGGRLHSKRLQDLPIEPGAIIASEQREVLVDYCFNDCDTTIDLHNHIAPQIELREEMSKQYGIDLRSKSDAQVAEAIIKHELERIKGDRIFRPDLPADYSFYYQPPSFLKFDAEQLQGAFDLICGTRFKLRRVETRVDDDAFEVGGVRVKVGGVALPKEIKDLKIAIGESVYRMGIGGLHSSEASIAHHTDANRIIRDADVASYYPSILLVCGLYPEHLGVDFLDVYRKIKERRMSAKRSKDKVTDMTLKIVLNGTFGKLGSKWSALYAPNLMLQVTLTGQLALLALIERLEEGGISVISANTDGIVSSIPRRLESTYEQITKAWERETGFELEFADYRSLYSRDVNNYIAIKTDGTVKQKGAYTFVGSKGSPAEKNPTNYVCIDAVIAYLTNGTPIRETLEWCADIRRFLTVRRVTGGALYDGQYLGKVVRWYYSTRSRSIIEYATNGNKVPKSEGAMPMMELSDGLPDDIDYDRYYAECMVMLGELGVM